MGSFRWRDALSLRDYQGAMTFSEKQVYETVDGVFFSFSPPVRDCDGTQDSQLEQGLRD